MRDEVEVLSAGAPKTGVRAAAEAYTARGGARIALRFATAPTIRAEVGSGAAKPDVVILPPGGMNEIVASGKADGSTRVLLGRVGAGVAVRDGAPLPDISTVESLRNELAAADTIAYNKASTGIYIEALFERLGIAAALAPKIRRQDNGAGVMTHLLDGRGRDLGFGAITEILVFSDRGVRLVGPLPDEIQNFTRYEAAVMTGAARPEDARGFVAFLASETARRLLAERGIESA